MNSKQQTAWKDEIYQIEAMLFKSQSYTKQEFIHNIKVKSIIETTILKFDVSLIHLYMK